MSSLSDAMDRVSKILNATITINFLGTTVSALYLDLIVIIPQSQATKFIVLKCKQYKRDSPVVSRAAGRRSVSELRNFISLCWPLSSARTTDTSQTRQNKTKGQFYFNLVLRDDIIEVGIPIQPG